MKNIKFVEKIVFLCIGLSINFAMPSSVCAEEILIDPFWVLSTTQQTSNTVTFGESTYKIDYYKNFGPIRLLHLASPCLNTKPVPRAYTPESDEFISLIIYLAGRPTSRTLSFCPEGYLTGDDSQNIGTAYYSSSNEHALVGLLTSQNKVELVPNDLINSLIIKEATAKNTTLEELPWELIVLMMTYEGTAKALQPVSKKFAALATSTELPIQDVLNSRKDLQNYLENDKIRAYQLPKLKIDFAGFNDEDLEKLVAANPNIIQLDLSNCKMITNSALAYLTKLPKLTFLDLSNCGNLTELGIEHLNNLTNLTYIDYKWTDITDKKTLDAYIAELGSDTIGPRRIQRVRLCSNAGDHVLAELIEANPHLIHLALHECKNITSLGFSNLQKLTKLTHLDLSKYRKITESDLEYIGALTSLTSLDLSNKEQLRDASLKWLQNLTNLTHLYLNQCEQLTGSGFSHLKNLTKLTTLELNGCFIDDMEVKHLSCFSNLTHLGLSGIVIASSMTCRTKITETGLAYLADLTKLTHLSLGGESMTDCNLQNLACLKKLGQLNLTGCPQITGSGFEYLEDLSDLTDLNLIWCGLTETGITRFADLTHLTHLLLLECSGLNDSSLEYLKELNNLTNLHLVLTFLPNISDAGLKHLADIPKLTDLSIVSCDTFTGSCFEHFSSANNSLSRLHIVGCKGLTDNGMAHIGNLTKVIELDFSGCTKLTGSCFECLKYLPNLQRLNLTSCENIADASFPYINEVRQLKALYLNGCRRITDGGPSYLVDHPNLQALQLPRGEELRKDTLKEYLEKINQAKGERLVQFLGRQNISIDELSTKEITVSLSDLITLKPYRESIRSLKLAPDTTDDFFKQLKDFPNLTSLDTNGCKNITDKGLEYLIGIPLTKLYLNGCKEITDTGIAHLKGMPLTDLSLCTNITDIGLKSLENMPLIWLNLNECSLITNIGLESLPTSITTLSLRGCCQITDTALQHILEKLTNLTLLDIGQCRNITGLSLQHLQKAPLTTLSLARCPYITDVDLEHLPKDLTTLSLSLCSGITSAGLQYVVDKLTALKALSLPYGKRLEGNIQEEYQKEVTESKEKLLEFLKSKNMQFEDLEAKMIEISGHDFHLLTPYGKDIRKLKLSYYRDKVMYLRELFPNLTELCLYHCSISDVGLENLSRNLTKLHLYKCWDVTDKGLKALSKNYPHLTKINLRECSKITHKGIKRIARHKPNLIKLNLHGCSEVTDEGIAEIADYCPSLTTLKLGGCWQVKESGVTKIAKRCPRLTKLDLSSTKVTDYGLKIIGQNCSQLTTLKLGQCDNVTDMGIKEIIEQCTLLKKLDLRATKVTGSGLECRPENCPPLLSLNLHGCYNVTDEATRWIAEHYHNLEHLDVGAPDITDSGCKCLSALKKLTSLNLSYCREITDSSIKEIAKHCTNLEKLELISCDKITNEGMIYLCDLHSLRDLTLPKSTMLGFTRLAGEELREYLNTLSRKWLVLFFHNHGITPEELPDLPNRKITANPDDVPILSHYNCTINGCEVVGLDLGDELEKYQKMLEEKSQNLLLLAFLNRQGANPEDLHNRVITAHASELPILFLCQSKVVKLSLMDTPEDPIDESVLKLLSNFPKLDALHLLGSPNITDESLQHLPQGLTLLDLSRCHGITDDALQYIKSIKNLSTLKLNCCNLTGAGFEYIEDLELTSLDLSMCANIDFKYLQQHDKLKCLSLSGAHVTDTDLQYLPKNLKELHLYACDNISDAGLQCLPDTLTKLELYHCQQITDAALQHIGTLNELTNLSLCPYTSRIMKGLVYLKDLPKLWTFLLPDGTQLWGEKLQTYLRWLSTLPIELIEFLEEQPINIDDTGVGIIRAYPSDLSFLASYANQITVLKLIHTKESPVTDADIQKVAQYFPRLTTLNLSECIKITDACLPEIAEHCPMLTKLNLSGCIQTTNNIKKDLWKKIPGLQIH